MWYRYYKLHVSSSEKKKYLTNTKDYSIINYTKFNGISHCKIKRMRKPHTFLAYYVNLEMRHKLYFTLCAFQRAKFTSKMEGPGLF